MQVISMEEQTRGRLGRLFSRKSIPPWMLTIWGVIEFSSSVQFVINAMNWASPYLRLINGRWQGGILLASYGSAF